jgi:hypothetical protein
MTTFRFKAAILTCWLAPLAACNVSPANHDASVDPNVTGQFEIDERAFEAPDSVTFNAVAASREIDEISSQVQRQNEKRNALLNQIEKSASKREIADQEKRIKRLEEQQMLDDAGLSR